MIFIFDVRDSVLRVCGCRESEQTVFPILFECRGSLSHLSTVANQSFLDMDTPDLSFKRWPKQ